jgi:hypothetical protein
MRRRIAAAGVVMAAVTVGGVAGAVIGIPGLSGASSSPPAVSTANTGESTPTPVPHAGGFGGAFGADKGVLDAAAKALKLSTKDLLAKVSDGKTTIADVAKQQNVDPQTVIDAMVAVAKTDISDLVNNPFPAGRHFKGGGQYGPGAFGFGFGIRGLGDSVDGVAKALGISSSDLFKDIANGQSLADIAKSKNVDVGKIVDTLVTDAKSRIDAAVKAGHLSQDEATKLESNLKDMITKAVNMAAPKGLGHFGGFGRHGGPGGFGPGGFGPGGPPVPGA